MMTWTANGSGGEAGTIAGTMPRSPMFSTLTASLPSPLRCRRCAHKVTLANLNAALPDDVVGCSSVKVEIRQAVSE